MKQEILKLDLAELDFGIYRILNYRRAEIERFFDEELPNLIDEALTHEGGARKAELEDTLAELGSELEKAAKELGLGDAFADGEIRTELAGMPKAQAYADVRGAVEALEDGPVFAESEEDRLYNVLYTFFSRYYRDGDFQPQQRRARDARYSVPYNGEDVHFHWRSKGSHYIKTTEELKSYSFRSGGWRVRFELVEAFQEPDNVKGSSRYFIPVADECRTEVSQEGNLFVVPFAFRRLTADEERRYKSKSDDIEGDSIQERIVRDLGGEIDPPEGVTRKDLSYHLLRYARKNRTDYFVHPRLGEFLREELDYYLKNEVLDIQGLTSTEAVVDRLGKLRVVHLVADRIIELLDDVESFQARLFEKRKFVVSNSYLVSIRLVPPDLWDEVLENEEQGRQWHRDFGIAARVSRRDLEEHPSLVVDTSLFESGFQSRLLSSFDDIDSATDGVLISGENFAALRTVLPTFRGTQTIVYIDPPYNTGNDGFMYKDEFQRHSTWITFLADRLALGRALLSESGLFFVSIGSDELERLRLLMREVFGDENVLPPLIWNRRHSQQQGLFKEYHEYVLGAGVDVSSTPPFVGGSGEIVAGAMKKVSSKNPASEFEFPAGVRCEAADGTEFSGRWGEGEWVELVSGRFTVMNGRTQSEVTLRAGWTQINQMRDFFEGKKEVIDTRGQRVLEFYFTSTGKLKVRKERDRVTPSTVLDSYGTQSQASSALEDILGVAEQMSYPKPSRLMEDLVGWPTGDGSGGVADFFAGSGTTGQAVIQLNRQDGGSRKFLLVDVETYFEPVLARRIRKLMFCPSWKGGRPAEQVTISGEVPDWVLRSPRLVQKIVLESYEDSLNNLDEAGVTAELEGGRGIRYPLLGGTETPRTFLATPQIEEPFAYGLDYHTEDGVRHKDVDLIATFNLIGGIRPIRYMDFDHNGRRYVVVEGACDGGVVLVVWRSVRDLDPEEERSYLGSRVSDAFGTKLASYATIWHNADSALPNSRSLDAEFKRLMFEPESTLA